MQDQETISLKHLISACLELAERGGEIARQVVSSGNLQIKEKRGPDDLLTIADLKVQTYIQGTLAYLWPNLKVIGEEDVHPSEKEGEVDLTRLDKVPIDPEVVTDYPISQITIYIDPIDATKEFTEGVYSNVTILIGIVVNDEAIAGVIYQPWSQDDNESPKGCLCWGIVGYGAEGLGPQETRDNLVVAVTRSRARTTERLEQGIKNLSASEIVRVGGTGYKSLLVAQGKVDVFFSPDPGTNKWDTCAGEAVIKSVGGDLTDINGNRINYNREQPRENKSGILASRQRNHKELVEKLNMSN